MKNILFSSIILLTFCSTIQAKQVPKANYKVAVFIYQGVELLDFAGPLEVFSNTTGFEVFTVAPKAETIVAMNKNIKFIPNYAIADCPQPDIIVFPGANMEGLMPIYNDTTVIKWIKEVHKTTTYTMSVCTGAAFLSKASILDGHTATTHWGAISNLQTITPKAKIVSDKRFVEDGKILTTAGVSAGLDGALHLVKILRGQAEAVKVSENIEYDKWNPDAGLVIGQEKTTNATTPVAQSAPTKTTKDEPLKADATDPVCGMLLSKGHTLTTTHKEQQIGFCSDACKSRFLNNPNKYVGK